VCRSLHHHRRLEKKFDRSAENQSFLIESVSAIQALKAMAIELASFFALPFEVE
jgi:ABC-type bacteriocin/lantibiotic exporter with double-glycine peptidase domain